MSSTHRGGQRSPADFYQTPPWVVHRLLDAVAASLPSGLTQWLEPCSGHGAIVKSVRSWKPQSIVVSDWTMVELEEERRPYLHCLAMSLSQEGFSAQAPYIGDFFTWAPGQPKGRYDVTIMNPPFSLAQGFIEETCKISTHVFALERLNFVEGEERYPLMTSSKPDLYILPQRPTFYLPDGTPVLGKNGSPATDSITYAWFHFHEKSTGKWRLCDLTPLSERKAKRIE